jgi:hypothetical protein
MGIQLQQQCSESEEGIRDIVTDSQHSIYSLDREDSDLQDLLLVQMVELENLPVAGV